MELSCRLTLKRGFEDDGVMRAEQREAWFRVLHKIKEWFEFKPFLLLLLERERERERERRR